MKALPVTTNVETCPVVDGRGNSRSLVVSAALKGRQQARGMAAPRVMTIALLASVSTQADRDVLANVRFAPIV